MYKPLIQTAVLSIGIIYSVGYYHTSDPIDLIIANIWIVGSLLYGKPKE